MPRKKAQVPAAADRRLARSDPPAFMFQPLRTRALAGLLDREAVSAKLVAIVAPVGYGKTVLMSVLLAELRRSGRSCIWLALDERDRSIDSVINALEALLDGREARLNPTQALFRGQEPVARRIEALADAANGYPLPVSIFIDNLDSCSDDALGPLLDMLVFRTPSSVQLVFSSTRELPLDGVRAQLEGLIRPLAAADLSFSTSEVAELLGPGLCRRIGPPGVDAVARRTEGWPAAARMAQIILGNAEDPQAALKAFSGSDEALAQLLNRQVLSGFPAELRAFLLCLAQLRSFSLELVHAAIGGSQAAEHLAYLIERNVFVIPLDRNRSWYRLHGLFRDYLLHEAERALPLQRRQQVLMLAARWCEAQGYWREAIDYALASGSVETASQLLDRSAASFVRDKGDVPQYLQWLDTLHERGQQAGPEAEYWYIWALAFHRRYETARQRSAQLAERLQHARQTQGDTRERRELQRRIAILRTSIDSLTDHLGDAHRGASQWLASRTAGDGGDDPFNVTAAHCIVSDYWANGFRFVEARRAIQSARESAFQAGSAYVDGWVSAYAALIPIYEGQYAAAWPDLVSALASTRNALGDDAGICGTLALVAARCAAGMGLEDEARKLLELGMPSAKTHGFLDAAACGLEAAVLLWQGTADEAFAPALLRDVASAYAPRLSLMLSCHLVRRLLQLGRLEEARAEAAGIGIGSADGGSEHGRAAASSGLAQVDALVGLVRVELLIAAGRYKQAAPLITEETRRAKAGDCVIRQVELALATATIAVRSNEPALAIRQITRAASLAATRRILRPFRDHRDTLAAVVSEARPSAWGFASDEERRFFAELCRGLPTVDASLQGRLAALHEEPRLLGQLTARELELLGYLDAGLSNQQLADRTGVSLTTIKWHLQNLYGKLDVSSRSAALARGRALSLLRA